MTLYAFQRKINIFKKFSHLISSVKRVLIFFIYMFKKISNIIILHIFSCIIQSIRMLMFERKQFTLHVIDEIALIYSTTKELKSTFYLWTLSVSIIYIFFNKQCNIRSNQY